MISIRTRLAVISAAVIAVVLAIAGFGQMILFEGQVLRQLEQSLEARILDVAGALKASTSGAAEMSRDPTDPRYRNPYSGAYWYVREGETFVLRSRSLWDDDIKILQSEFLNKVERTSGPEGASVYVRERPVVIEGLPPSLVIGVALAATETEEQLAAFRHQTIKSLVLIGLVLFAGAFLQTLYGLHPLSQLRAQLRNMHQGKQDRLAGPFPAEVNELATDLNGLFQSQKQMIDKAREQAGTLAHGIKTPMTILYGELRKLETDSASVSAAQMRGQLDLIGRQVDRALSRARVRGASAGIGIHADFSETAARLAGLMHRMPRGDILKWNLPLPGVTVAMDSDDLGEVLGNLLDNARKNAATTVTVSVSAGESQGVLGILVSNDEHQVRESGHDDDIRSGTGLGLKIASEVVFAYGSSLRLNRQPNGLFCASFEIPGNIATSA